MVPSFLVALARLIQSTIVTNAFRRCFLLCNIDFSNQLPNQRTALIVQPVINAHLNVCKTRTNRTHTNDDDLESNIPCASLAYCVYYPRIFTELQLLHPVFGATYELDQLKNSTCQCGVHAGVSEYVCVGVCVEAVVVHLCNEQNNFCRELDRAREACETRLSARCRFTKCLRNDD